MTEDLQSLIAEYRAGLEAEIALLRQLDSLSEREHDASHTGDYAALRRVHDARDTVMRNLVSIEHELKPLRGQLAERRHVLQRLHEFHAVESLHAAAVEMVDRIIASDQESLKALEQAEHARRAAATATEKGESTLQAYKRVIAPAASGATLLNRRG